MTHNIFDTLRHIIQDVNDASGLEEALNIVVQRTRQEMSVDAVSIYFRDHKTKDMVLMATDGLNQNAIGKIRFKLNEGLIGLVSNQTEPVNIKDAHKHPNYRFMLETDEKHFHGFLGVPIIRHRQVLGVLVVRKTRIKRFSNNSETFLVTLAAQLAGAISHAEKIGKLTRLLENVNDGAFHLKGIGGSAGVSIGRAHVVFPPSNLDAVPDQNISGDEIQQQIKDFHNAVDNVHYEFKQLSEKMKDALSSEALALFDVFSLMLKSDLLINSVINRIKDGQWAQGALRETISEHIKQFNTMEDDYFRERAVDIKDLGRRILMHLQKQQVTETEITTPCVLVGDEIVVSQFTEVPLQYLMGVISTQGSALSHVAILSNALGIPCVMGVENLPVNRIKGQEVIVDGYRGEIYVKPTLKILRKFEYQIKQAEKLDEELYELIDKPSETLDKIPVTLNVNTGLQEDISSPLTDSAHGVGLYRTEIPFITREGFPGENEQTEIYREILRRFTPRPVTFRTLDIGGDKSLPYFPVIEENPFLGWRGIRIMLDHPEIFLTQIRAILKANIFGSNLRLMLPMISDISEVEAALKLIRHAHTELNNTGLPVPFPPIGVMIEVPSAVYQIEAIIKKVDFISIGTNDLTQYLLAVDRNNKQVASLYNCLHPSVLMAIQHIIKVSHNHNKTVSVCGEMAGDPISALALIGLGADSLSMSVNSLLKVKWVIRSFTHVQATRLVEECMMLESASAIRSLLNNSIEQAGLGRLIVAASH